MEQQEKLWTKDFVLLTLCNLLLFLSLQMVITPLPAYVKSTFHADNFTISLVISLFALAAVLSRVVTGELLKKKSKLLILLIGLGLAGLSTAGYYWSATIGLLLVMRILFGFGFGMASTTFPTMVTDIIPNKRIGEGMGYFGFSTSLALSIGPIIGLALLNQTGFGSLIVAATLTAVLAIPLLYFVSLSRKPHILPHKTEPSAGFVSSLASDWLNQKLLFPAFMNFLLSVTYGGLLSFIALFGQETRIENVGLFFLCNALAVVLIRPISGKLFDRRGHIAVLIPGATLTIIGLFTLSYSHSTMLMLVAALFYGLGYGILQPSIQAWMIKEVSVQQRGIANGIFLNSIDLGVAVGSMLLGGVATHTGYAGMYRVSALFMVLFIVVYSIIMLRQSARNKLSQKMALTGSTERFAGVDEMRA